MGGDSLQDMLKKNILLADELASLFYDFREEDSATTARKFDEFLSGLQEVERFAEGHTQNTRIPASVLECIDRGENPDKVTREMLVALMTENSRANGKIKHLESVGEKIKEKAKAPPGK
ncbi:MAG: mediator complex subunit Med10 [Amphiamblys sp. WSBS2006]|nr:MAG: mediator complex subunit Med10 [Amphiamblys sp. WSBS2006]